MIRAGWFVQFRVYGLGAERLPLGYTVTDQAAPNTRPIGRVDCSLSSVPQIPPTDGELPTLTPGTIPAGQWQIEIKPPANTGPLHAPSMWFSAHASDEYELAPELESAWFRKDSGSRTAVLNALESRLLREIRPRAELVAGIWAVLYGAKAFTPSTSSPTLWVSGTSWLCMGRRFLSPVVEPHILSDAEVQEQAAVVCANAFMPGEHEVEILRRASSWYLRGKGEATDSMERFVWFFLCLEALTYLADQSADPDAVAKYSRLLTLVADASASEDLMVFVTELGGRVKQAPLTKRFRRLANHYSASTADEDVSQFAAFAKVRNRLFHGDSVAQGTFVETLSLNSKIESLAFRYVSAIVQARFEASRSRIIRPG